MLKQISKNSQKVQKLIQKSQQFISVEQQQLGVSLKQKDPQLYDIIENEKIRQIEGINLIASENHCSRAVLEALASPTMVKYADGFPGQRIFPGCKQIDQIETLCQKRALQAFDLNPEEWGVNVQAYSGCNANFAVYTGLLKPHDRIIGLNLPEGGHLSHGFQIRNKKISMVSQFFESFPYKLDKNTGEIDYDKMEEIAQVYNPKIIVNGASAYSRLINYERFKKVADDVGAYILCDMAHISGLVCGKQISSPFPYADIVTTTTHKSLRGPRGSMIFYRKGVRSVNKQGVKTMYDIGDKINYAVSPMNQSGAHYNNITALAVALKQSLSPEFKFYQQQVVKNSKSFASEFQKLGYELVSGGTDNHLFLINLKPSGYDGPRAEKLFDLLHIYTNKNTVPGDSSAQNPSGIRVGTPAMTTRGLLEKDFKEVSMFMHRALNLIPKLKKDCPGKKISDFIKYINENEQSIPEIVVLKQEINEFSKLYPIPSLEHMN